MLYNKACAIALLNKVKEERGLIIEDQYTKNDLIFYKFKYSNVAVTKRLNNLDLSILSEQDWDFLFGTVTNEYIEEHERELETAFNEYYSLINNWSKEESMISKMYNFINDSSLNDRTIAQTERILLQNKIILDLLIHNKAHISRNASYGSVGRSITFDVVIGREIVSNITTRNGGTSQGIKIELTVGPTDNNINVIRDVINEDIEYGREEDSVVVNRVNILLGFLIMRYNRNIEDRAFIEHKEILYKIKSNGNVSEQNSDVDFARNYKNLLLNVLTSSNSGILFTLFGGYYYYNIWEIRRAAGERRPELNIDYSAMSSEHLNLFKNMVEWLIARHARYIGVNERERETFCMFLGGGQLKGKKATKEALTARFNLPNMYAEIDRREGER